MIETVYDSTDVPARERFEYWRACRVHTHAPVEMSSSHAEDYRAYQRTLTLGTVTASVLRFQPIVLRRTPKLIRHRDPEKYHVSIVLDGIGGSAWHHRERRWRTADIVTQSSSLPCTMWADDDQPAFRMAAVEIPRASLSLPPGKAEEVIGLPYSARDGIGALLAGFLTRLAAESHDYRPSDGPRLGTVAADLVSTLFAHALEADSVLSPETRRRVLRLRIRAFVDQQLGNPDLDPAMIAAAHHISVSYLHRLFQADGTPVMAWVRLRRLERARQDLGNPNLRALPVHRIAARWGFRHHAAFTRAFRAAYGLAPTDCRQRPGDVIECLP